ncbi:MAG TPA: elongation factor G [Candidatus Atribacteria bacterium]|uniref:elongation factor G n=1 Tax=Candidatus Sordicultor fermentans TaxID=1953203 RepID=UPI0016A1EDAC|nr:elongation factor G [Atribacterota bacterium]NLY06133.1 elongation factor G [Candidatus Atribacteria bacterium]HOA99381.1 elongation factor G [Candidatus Atribacteria bacterium]HPT63644.1 elongation factor G [Candidatus Atribacteria bacterium]HQD33029.1 elongation factor G [Candidatus Atribacteria bacterium]
MNSFTSKNIRNVGLFSHAGSGKTTLSEALLFNAGLLSRRGKVEEGNTVSDWQPEEIKRGISIDLSILPWEWKGCKVNLIDTPGYADFVGNVLGAIRAVDSAVVLLCATSGVEVGTEKVWEYISRENLPVIFFINRMDREGANFDEAVEELQEKINPRATPLFIPVGKESDFRGVIDLLHFRALYFGKEGKVEEGEIPEEMKEVAQRARENLVENIAETNDDLLDLYLEGQEISPSQLEEALRVAIRERHIFPILCGSGVENKGVDILADFLVDFAPSPLERPPVRGINPLTEEEEERKCDENEPFSALVFKIISDPYVGKLALFRVFSGKISSDSRLYNASRGVEEKVGQLLFLRGKNQESAKEIKAGDIGVVAKIDEVYIGDTLADREHPIVFPPISYPEPTYMAAIRPLGKGDEEKISQALSRLMEEDPTFRLYRDPDTKEDIVYGMGDIHLDVLTEKMKRKFGVEVSLTIPQVPYKETIKKPAKAEGKYKRQSGGRGQYGHAFLELEPLPRGQGFEFVDKIVGGVIPRNYIPAVEKGVQEAMQEGVLAGYPVIDVRATVYDGSYHPVDSSDMAFKIAGSMAFKKGASEAEPVLLEPIMSVEVIVPEEYMGDVIGDLNSRRGRILGMDPQDSYQKIRALVPLAELFRYSVDLRSLTQGQGYFTMKFSHYEEVPAQLAEAIIEKAKKEKEAVS